MNLMFIHVPSDSSRERTETAKEVHNRVRGAERHSAEAHRQHEIRYREAGNGSRTTTKHQHGAQLTSTVTTGDAHV